MAISFNRLHIETLVMILLLHPILICSCKKDNNPSNTIIVTNDTELKDVSDFPVGIQAFIGIMDFQVPASRVTKSFDRYTAATFFWSGIEPTQGNFNFTDADRCVAFAQSNNLRLHGHPLVYFQNGVSPDYVNQFSGDKPAFEAMVKNHIQTIVSRYKGKYQGYDVVNEMVNDFKGTDFFNNTMEQFYQTDEAYTTFIGKCFKWAKESDPDAKLFYNEALLELTDGKRLAAVIRLVNKLKSQGMPIDGVGTQMHTDIYCPVSVIENTLSKLAGTGLLVHISELDVSVNNDSNKGENFNFTVLTPDLSARQKAMYKAIVSAYRTKVPDKQKWGITVWDLMDHTSWLNQYRKEFPCLYDSSAEKKPAFIGFGEGLLGIQ